MLYSCHSWKILHLAEPETKGCYDRLIPQRERTLFADGREIIKRKNTGGIVMLFQLYGETAGYQLLGFVLVFTGLV